MESTYLFRIYYDNKPFCTIVAHTKWEAVDKAYFKYPNLERSKLKAVWHTSK